MDWRILTGVGGVFCCAHEPKGGGPLHGHTYQVICWFKSGDADMLKQHLDRVLKHHDHSKMPHHLTWGEDIARWLGTAVTWPNGIEIVRVEVNRPLEMIYARWERD